MITGAGLKAVIVAALDLTKPEDAAAVAKWDSICNALITYLKTNTVVTVAGTATVDPGTHIGTSAGSGSIS